MKFCLVKITSIEYLCRDGAVVVAGDDSASIRIHLAANVVDKFKELVVIGTILALDRPPLLIKHLDLNELLVNLDNLISIHYYKIEFNG